MPSVKEIYKKISDVTIDADTINLNTDTVEALLSTVQADVALVKADMANGVLVNGTVTSLVGGETPTSGTTTLTNDTRWELGTEGFEHIAIEIVSTGASWGSNGVVAQAYNGTAPSNADIFAPAGIRYRHSTDGATLNQALNNFYYNLNIAPNAGNGYGTSFIRIDGNTNTTLGLPSTGTRYFLFDLTTEKFALRPNFTAGTAQVKYRLYKGRHPFFSARNVIVRGEGSDGKVSVEAPDGITVINAVSIQDGDGNTFGIDRSFPIDGSVTATDLGVKADAVATTDTGTFSVIALIKRGLQNWTSLLAKIPTLVSGRIPVDGSGVTQPVSLADGTINYVSAIADGDGSIFGIDRNFPVDVQSIVTTYSQQGTTVSNTTFSSATSATLASFDFGRKVVTVFNEGPATLFINIGPSASTTSYQVRLLAGDYWEAPAGQQSLQHSGIFSSAGSTARVTTVT